MSRAGTPYASATQGAEALRQGMIAVNSILRDWVKGQTVAIEAGIMSVSAAFLPYMVGAGGQTLAEHAEAITAQGGTLDRMLLAAPEAD